MADDTAKFTLRFRDERTHQMLGLIADQRGISKNRLAEEMLERELRVAALLVANDLDDTLRRLAEYHNEDRLEGDIAAFAEGEAFGDDPLRARMVESSMDAENADPYGVLEAFAD
jgi:hypothetical protein